MIHQEGTTVVFQWTTPHQLKLIVGELEQRYNEVRDLCRKEEEEGGFVTPLSHDLDQLVNGLENILSDLECDGFEREEAPRYNRWLDS